MLDTRPIPSEAAAALAPLAVDTVLPDLTIRPATAEEQYASRVWHIVAEPNCTTPDVVQFSDGSMTHAPEVIAAYRQHSAGLPVDFTLIYLHRGAQVQCVNPLLPSLLHLTGHTGPSHALRRDNSPGLAPEVQRFTRAMTPSGGAALIIDDRQLRLAPTGRVVPEAVHFHTFIKPGLVHSLATGDKQ